MEFSYSQEGNKIYGNYIHIKLQGTTKINGNKTGSVYCLPASHSKCASARFMSP